MIPALLDQARIDGSLLVGADRLVSDFVRARIPHMRDQHFSPHVAIGVIRNGQLCGGVVFHSLRTCHGKPLDIEMSAAFDDPRWCLPATLRKLFAYPFIQLGCIRMTTITGRKNKRARRIDVGLGFQLEGVARKAIDGKEDAMIYGMLRSDCRFIPKENRHG